VQTIYPHHPENIRLINPHKDLAEIADLIELCFQSQMDPDGLQYINLVREISRHPERIQWFPVRGEMFSYPLFGFVWVQNDKIVGNLTIIPLRFSGDWIFLIANVAVHPDYRRLGIARHLTERAVTFARLHHIDTLWLHVRDDNLPAITLYQKYGFQEVTRRTTWFCGELPSKNAINGRIKLIKRSRDDWTSQVDALDENYPPELRWNIPLRISRLQPGILSEIQNFLLGSSLKQYTILNNSAYAGVISYEPSEYFADYLWLAFRPENKPGLLQDVIACLVNQTRISRPVQVNHQSNIADQEFINAGFESLHTLIWMKANIAPY